MSLRTWLHTDAIGLVDDDTVGGNRRHESESVAELRPSGVVVESDVGQSITSHREKEGGMTDEPTLTDVS